MNKNICFVRTIIPADQFKKKYETGGLVIYHAGEELDSDMNAYKCYECSVPTPDFSEEDVLEAYNKFKESMDKIELLNAVRAKKAEINAYDTKEGAGCVNNFYFEYGGQKFPYWFNAYERTALSAEATAWAKKYGTYRIDARKYGVSFEISCDTLLEWLGQLSDYAIKCFNKTSEHLRNVEALTSVVDVEKYDYKTGYPDNLIFKIK